MACVITANSTAGRISRNCPGSRPSVSVVAGPNVYLSCLGLGQIEYAIDVNRCNSIQDGLTDGST